MNRQIWLIYLLCSCLLIACGKRTVGTSSGPIAEELAIEPLDFDYLTSSSKIRFSNDGQSVSATANIRMKRDSVIWISVTPGFGIEAARAMITQDSVRLMNRLDKEYEAYSFQELSNKFNFGLSYGLLQAMLVGDLLRPLTAKDQVNQRAEHFVVRQEENSLTLDSYVDARRMKVDRLIATGGSRDTQTGRRGKNTLNLLYEDFEQVDGQWLPFRQELSLDYRQRGEKRRTQIDIQHKKANIVQETLQFPFSIPEKYARK